jgi:hypothetical protein
MYGDLKERVVSFVSVMKRKSLMRVEFNRRGGLGSWLGGSGLDGLLVSNSRGRLGSCSYSLDFCCLHADTQVRTDLIVDRQALIDFFSSQGRLPVPMSQQLVYRRYQERNANSRSWSSTALDHRGLHCSLSCSCCCTHQLPAGVVS